MPLVDLSHVIESGMTTYPGLPAPLVCDYLTREASRSRYADGATFHIGKIEMVANTGTYVDAGFVPPTGETGWRRMSNYAALLFRSTTTGLSFPS